MRGQVYAMNFVYSGNFIAQAEMDCQGQLRLVMGMGTSAVDRTEGSYPRLVTLDNPQATSCTTIREKHQYSQRMVEAMDVSRHQLVQMELKEIKPKLPPYLARILLEHDYEAERMFRDRGIYRDISFISCEGIVRNGELMEQMRTILELLQAEYRQPVDIEYTINLSEEGEHSINLLQCRPLQVFKDEGMVEIPGNLPESRIILENTGSSMGLSRKTAIDLILFVDPVSYYNMPYADKTRIAGLIRKINWEFRGKGKHMMLIVPGRIGTSSPELGVPTTFADISEFEVICEVEEKKAGYNPELSYGSHIFQDLVEAEILYTAIFSDERTKLFDPEKLKTFPEISADLFREEDAKIYEGIITVYDTGETGCLLYHDLEEGRLVLTIGREEPL